jgi:hypothetical protein
MFLRNFIFNLLYTTIAVIVFSTKSQAAEPTDSAELAKNLLTFSPKILCPTLTINGTPVTSSPQLSKTTASADCIGGSYTGPLVFVLGSGGGNTSQTCPSDHPYLKYINLYWGVGVGSGEGKLNGATCCNSPSVQVSLTMNWVTIDPVTGKCPGL